MKIFLATSFSGKVDPANGTIIPEFKTFVTHMLELLRAEGHEVFNALEYEGWKASNQAAELAIQKDLQEINNADVLLAIVHDTPSAGVQFELGYAAAKDKHVILMRQSNEQLSYYNQGIISSGLVTLISYDNVSMILPQLTVALTGRNV